MRNIIQKFLGTACFYGTLFGGVGCIQEHGVSSDSTPVPTLPSAVNGDAIGGTFLSTYSKNCVQLAGTKPSFGSSITALIAFNHQFNRLTMNANAFKIPAKASASGLNLTTTATNWTSQAAQTYMTTFTNSYYTQMKQYPSNAQLAAAANNFYSSTSLGQQDVQNLAQVQQANPTWSAYEQNAMAKATSSIQTQYGTRAISNAAPVTISSQVGNSTASTALPGSSVATPALDPIGTAYMQTYSSEYTRLTGQSPSDTQLQSAAKDYYQNTPSGQSYIQTTSGQPASAVNAEFIDSNSQKITSNTISNTGVNTQSVVQYPGSEQSEMNSTMEMAGGSEAISSETQESLH